MVSVLVLGPGSGFVVGRPLHAWGHPGLKHSCLLTLVAVLISCPAPHASTLPHAQTVANTSSQISLGFPSPSFQKRMNLTKTVRKAPITMDMQRVGPTTEDSKRAPHKYDEADRFVSSVPGVQERAESRAVDAGACRAKVV